MKYLFMCLLVGCTLHSKAQQAFSRVADLFNKDSKEIIKIENSTSNDGFLNTTLESVASTDNGYIMTYGTSNSSQLHQYYFNENNMCYAFKTLDKIGATNEQMEYLRKSKFTPLQANNRILNHSTLNLRVLYNEYPEDGYCTFTYTTKQTPFPK